MPAFIRAILALILVCLASLTVAQSAEQLAARRTLGPQWKLLSRSAGSVFAGTVLSVAMQPPEKGHPLPTVELKFRIDRGIVGAHTGQVVTIREWAGAWSMHRTMQSGQHVLLFLYPPSRLGLTSPVGGRLGQVMLDAKGKNVDLLVPASNFNVETGLAPSLPAAARAPASDAASRVSTRPLVSVKQLERAIRSAREE